METTCPSARAVSKAEGFLAGLVYLDSALTAFGQSLDPLLLNPQLSHSWAPLLLARAKLEGIRLQLVNATHNMHLTGLDSILDSFVTPMNFYEAAIGGFRNTLLGLPPTTLGNIVALCSLSHITLYDADYQTNFNYFSNFNLWRNTISDRQHRQAFSDLIKAVCLDPHLTRSTSYSLSALDVSYPLQPNYQEELSTTPALQNDCVQGSFWDFDPGMHGFWAADSLLTCQAGQYSYPASYSTQLNDAEGPDLQSLQLSPIVRNLCRFLEGISELTIILSGRRVRAKPTERTAEPHIKSLYIRHFQRGDPFKNPMGQGLISVVERFIDLGYLQNMDEVRDYLLLVGKEILPSGQTFVEFCQSVCGALNRAESRIASSRTRRFRISCSTMPKQKKVPCDICGRLFTRKTNMKRHMERKHRGVGDTPTPMILASPRQT